MSLASQLILFEMENFILPVKIRYSDIDMNRHVNNAVYFTYMENARTELLANELVSYQEKGIDFIISEASCKYKRPVLLTDNVICELSFKLLSPLRLGINYIFRNNDTGVLNAEGYTVLVMIKQESGKPVRIPREMQEFLI